MNNIDDILEKSGLKEPMEGLIKGLESMIDGFSQTHGPKGSPMGQKTNMPQLRANLRSLIVTNLPEIQNDICNLLDAVDERLSKSELRLVNRYTAINKLKEPFNAQSRSEWVLMESLELLLRMVVLRRIASETCQKLETLSRSCNSLIGFTMMVLADTNGGFIPERFIDILSQFDIKISRLGDDEIKEMVDKGLSLDKLKAQSDKRMKAVFGISKRGGKAPQRPLPEIKVANAFLP
jgi:hypothetical protein